MMHWLPVPIFLAQQNFQLDNFIDLVFPDTALGEYLNRAAEAYNVSRKPATNAVRKMTTSGSVEIGTRWGINNLVYIVKEEESETEYQVECETPGVIGNQYSGAMQPISNITGITAELGTLLPQARMKRQMKHCVSVCIPKSDFRLLREMFTITNNGLWRFLEPAQQKVFPLADGPGTVTVLVVDSDKKISSSLPKTVAEYIETMRPIGATVTVKSPDSVTINIKASVMRNESKTLDDVKKHIRML